METEKWSICTDKRHHLLGTNEGLHYRYFHTVITSLLPEQSQDSQELLIWEIQDAGAVLCTYPCELAER